MAFRRFIKAHRYTDEAGRVIVIPSGWAGELSANVVKSADEAGATIIPQEERKDDPKPKAKAKD